MPAKYPLNGGVFSICSMSARVRISSSALFAFAVVCHRLVCFWHSLRVPAHFSHPTPVPAMCAPPIQHTHTRLDSPPSGQRARQLLACLRARRVALSATPFGPRCTHLMRTPSALKLRQPLPPVTVASGSPRLHEKTASPALKEHLCAG